MSAWRRVSRLGRTEMILFWRNRIAVLTALFVPLSTVGLFAAISNGNDGDLSGNAIAMTGLLGAALLFVVYYNLVTAYVARREELVLKRLRTGECSDGEIVLATAVPAIAITLAQAVLAVAVGAVVLGLPMPVNPLLLGLGLLAGIALFVLLAAISTAFTRTVELAQVSTMPVLLLCLVGSGAFLPLTVFPAEVERVARLVPLTPVIELIRLGWLGTTGTGAPMSFGAALGASVVPFAILAGWIGLGWFGLRRWFRWEPRR